MSVDGIVVNGKWESPEIVQYEAGMVVYTASGVSITSAAEAVIVVRVVYGVVVASTAPRVVEMVYRSGNGHAGMK